MKKYGTKVYQSLSDIVSQGAEAVREDYRKFIPTDEELKTKYSGIGKNYEGILFREHFESCIQFHEKAEKRIPKGTRYRAQILKDIKDSASGSINDLMEFYSSKGETKKKKAAETYL